MRNRLSDWLDERTGYKAVMHEALDEPIPGGARWRYIFGSALTATFFIQLATGLLLMTSYSPSSTTAWGSVFYINNEMTLGWFIRGIHHFGSQAMVVLLGLHMIQVLLAGAYRAPREINWWFGLVLMFVTLGFSLTGYLLPWDQKGYWATKVATNIAGGTPFIGPYLQKVVVGGTEYGNQTLTRFYGLHVGLLPLALFGALAAHVALFRKHGVTAPQNATGSEPFWPKQFFMDTVGSVIVFGVLVGLVLMEGGANLDSPADPSSSNYPARPEWYFLSLFQLLKYFEGDLVLIGTFVIPTAILVVLFALPLLDKVVPRGFAHFLACACVFGIVGGAGYLTVVAVRADQSDWGFRASRIEADEARARAVQIAADPGHRIPPEGAAYLLRRDPFFNGGHNLRGKCLSCHYYGGEGMVTRVISDVKADDLAKVQEPITFESAPAEVLRALSAHAPGFKPAAMQQGPGKGEALVYTFKGVDGQGDRVEATVSADAKRLEIATYSKQTAADLDGFGSTGWLRGLLEKPDAPAYFGNVPQAGGMKRWKKNSKLGPKELDAVAEFVTTFVAKLADEEDESVLEADEAAKAHPGYKPFLGECLKCHILGIGGEAPDLSGWGSDRWLARMIKYPGAEDLYGYLAPEEQMPAFAERLTEADLDNLIAFLKGRYLPPAGPSPSPSPTEPKVAPPEAVAAGR